MHTSLDGAAQSFAHAVWSLPLHSHCDVQSLQPMQLSAVLQPAGRTGGVLSAGGVLEQLATHSSYVPPLQAQVCKQVVHPAH
jgi:hypothetical protein